VSCVCKCIINFDCLESILTNIVMHTLPFVAILNVYFNPVIRTIQSLKPKRVFLFHYANILKFSLYLWHQIIKKEELVFYSKKKVSIIYFTVQQFSRSQWSSDLKHKLSSLAKTLRSCVWIPLAAWMFVCVNCVFSPIAVAVRSMAWTVFARSTTEIVGSNPTGSMDVCVCSVRRRVRILPP
jgi:hypothetical protein